MVCTAGAVELKGARCAGASPDFPGIVDKPVPKKFLSICQALSGMKGKVCT